MRNDAFKRKVNARRYRFRGRRPGRRKPRLSRCPLCGWRCDALLADSEGNLACPECADGIAEEHAINRYALDHEGRP